MTSVLAVSRHTPIPSPASWFQMNITEAIPVAFTAADISPNAVYYNGKTYIGFIDGAGSVRVATYNHTSHAVTVSPEIITGLTIDEHNSPSLIIRQSDQKILIAACDHSGTPMYVALSTNAEDISAWGAATNIASSIGAVNYTYPNLVQLSGESGKVYLFYREERNGSGNVPGTLCFSTSTDAGATWSAQTRLYENATTRSYYAVDSDSTSRIDFICTDGDADLGNTASVYHFYYSGSAYHKSDGTSAGSATLAPSNLTKIYDGSTNGSARAIWSVINNGSNPLAAWVAYNSGATTKVYWYGLYNGGSWSANSIDTTGAGLLHPNFDEGGVTIDRTNTSRVYTSKLVSSVWQIMKYETANSGTSWTSSQITTTATPDDPHLRPFSPKNAAAGLPVIWRRGPDYFNNGVEPAFGKLIGYPNPITAF